MDRCVIAHSIESDKDKAAFEIFQKLEEKSVKPKLIIVFSEKDILWFLAKELKNKYQDAIVIGSTSYINFTPSAFSYTGTSVMCINSGIECSGGMLFEINRYPAMYKAHISNALNSLSSAENTCCLEFSTAFGKGEEMVLDTFNEILENTGIPVIGSTAGASVQSTETYVCYNGDLFANTCVFVFIHNLNGKISYCVENNFKPTEHKFLVTDIDCEERIVYELNEKPAVTAMCEEFKIPPEEISVYFRKHPMGRVLGNQIYASEFDRFLEDGGISFFTKIFNHTKLVLLEQDDCKKIWKESISKIKSEIPKPSFSILINCMWRSMIFETEKLYDDFTEDLKQLGNYITVSGYGEQIEKMHQNQTFIYLVFE